MGLTSELTRRFRRRTDAAIRPLFRLNERQLVLQVQHFSRSNRDRNLLHGLYEAEYCAFSQWGEDGIIDWLIERLPGIPPSFIEFGVADYKESNTRLLLQMRDCRGLVMDGSRDSADDIRAQDVHWRHDLSEICAFIDRDNINGLIAEQGLKGAIGLLGIDIDGNDYWVWEAIHLADPVIVVCEYNAVFGDRYSLTIPYQRDFFRTRAHHSNLYFGASIQALIRLARRKGYTFVGSASSGVNALFVRIDRAPAVLAALEGVWAFPSAVRESRDSDGRLTFLRGMARAEPIEQLPLLDLKRNVETKLASCSDLYSDEWNATVKTVSMSKV